MTSSTSGSPPPTKAPIDRSLSNTPAATARLVYCRRRPLLTFAVIGMILFSYGRSSLGAEGAPPSVPPTVEPALLTTPNYVPALFGLAGTMIGASISAYSVYLNSNLTRKARQRDLYKMLISELRILGTHCNLSATSILNTSYPLVPRLKMAKYASSGMITFDLKEMYILNDNLCQDIMHIILCVRNTDILIDNAVKIIETAADADNENVDDVVIPLSERLRWIFSLADAIRFNLEKHIRDPRRYNEPQIQWGSQPNTQQKSVQES